MTAPHGDATSPGRETVAFHAMFHDGAVVQLISADPRGPDALAVPIDEATIEVTERRVVARTSSAEWSWLVNDLERVTHGPHEPWTILAVPGVDDHGVAVAAEDAAEFRACLDRLLSGRGIVATVGAPAPPAVAEARLIDLSNGARGDAHVEGEIDAADLTIDDRLTDAVQEMPPEAVSPTTPPRPHAAVVTSDEAPTTAPAVVELEARRISAWFGTHHVLDRVSLQMPAGEVTALIGPSGCGKSTFLRILNRMHEMIPSAALAGEVLLDGADIYDAARRLTDARRQIGMVFQKPNPFPAMSIYDNVVASYRLTGTKVGRDEKDHIVESCLAKAGLWNEVRDRLRQPGGGLSGGQQQRLCIARALAIKPKVLLMDEPCSALDPTSTRRIERTIMELAEEVTIVIVTHNMQQAARVSHRCAFFLAEQGTPGVIVEHGPTDAMFSDPQDRRTSDYVQGRFG